MIKECDKTLKFAEAMCRAIHTALKTPDGSGLICFNPDPILRCLADGIASGASDFISEYRKRPCPEIRFNNGFTLHFRNGRNHGQGLRGIQLKTFILADKKMTDKSEALSAEVLMIIKKSCDYRSFTSSFDGYPDLYFDLGTYYAKTVISRGPDA